MTEFRAAGNVTVENLILMSYEDPERSVDIRANFVQINFVESMLSPFMTGYVDIAESSGMLYPSIKERSAEKPHVRGEEMLYVEYTDHNNRTIKEVYMVYAIDEIKQDSNKDTIMQYRLHFASLQKIMSEKFIIQKTYRNMTYSEMVRDIFQEYYINQLKPILDPKKASMNENIRQYIRFYKSCEIELTDERHTIVIPSLRPEQAIQYIMRQAYSTSNSSSLFFFFESRSKFYFITHEQLVKRNKVMIELDDFNFAVSIGGNDASADGQQKAKQTISKVTFPEINSIEAMKSSAFIRSVGEIDLLNRNVQQFYYNYKDQYLGYENIDPRPQLTNSQEYLNDISEKVNIPDNFMFKDYLTPEEGNSNRSDNYDRNLPRYIETQTTKPVFEYHFKKNQIKGNIPGRHFMSPGYVIKTIAPEYTIDSMEKNRVEDEYFAGLQMVVTTNSIITSDDQWITGLSFTKAGRGGGKQVNRPGSATGAELTIENESDTQEQTIAGSVPEGGGTLPFAAPVSGTVEEREQKAMDFFVDKGYTPQQAAGIVANLTNESGMDINAINPNDAGPGNDSKGLAQWNKGRLDNMESFAKGRGADVNFDSRGNPIVPFETQLEFVDHELRGQSPATGYGITGSGAGGEAAAYTALENAGGNTQRSTLAMTGYERFDGWTGGMGNHEVRERVATSTRIYNTYQQRGQGI